MEKVSAFFRGVGYSLVGVFKFLKVALLLLALAIIVIVCVVLFREGKKNLHESGDYVYRICIDGTAEIASYKGKDSIIVIPDTLDGYRVTSLGTNSFHQNSLTSITIPDGVVYIGEQAFRKCKKLTRIDIPDSVGYIGEAAFEECVSLSQVKLPDSLRRISDHMFYRCGSLIELAIPDGIVSIGDRAFAFTGLTHINLPGSLIEIGDFAFYNCANLEEIVIPEGVVFIGNGGYDGCFSLTSITIPNSVTSISKHAFEDFLFDIIFMVGRGSYAEAFLANTNYAYEYFDETTSY